MDGGCGFYYKLLLLLFVFRVSEQCANDEFLCQGGYCLPREKVCDGYIDCNEGDDENNCQDNIQCSPPKWFQCRNGQCLSSSMYCDGNFDCSDFSDEPETCFPHDDKSKVKKCTSDEFQCLNGFCIKKSWICDGEPDCSDGSDETVGCGRKMECEGGFRCKNHHCIIKDFVCDGENDCHDNSDEENCTTRFHSVEHCFPDKGLFLCHDEIACLDNANVCDGFPHCFDNSDEIGCAKDSKINETYCKSIGCSHNCHLAPDNKIICICPTGYKLDHTMKNCVDLDECEEFGFCYQKCKNSIGSYQCLCDEGYSLRPDNRSCRAKGGEPLLLFSSFKQIRGIYLKSKVYFSVSTQENRIIGVSHNGKHVYWTEINRSEAAILRSNEDGSDKVVLINSGLGLPEDLEIDYITGNIYYTDVEKKHIGVCTESGICSVLHNEDIDKPRAIALYPQKSIMFWTDWGRVPKIASSGMDGSNPKILIQEHVEWPNGLALDTGNDRLYWVDAKSMNIETARLDGSDRRVILKNAVKHPFSISVFEDMLYWSDWENVQIEKCNKFTGKNHSSLVKEKSSEAGEDKTKHLIYGVHIYHPALHPRMPNPCENHACSHLCLLSPNNTYKCLCPENYKLGSDLHTCRKNTKSLQIAAAGKTHIHIVSPRLLGKQSQSGLNLDKHISNIECIAYDSLTGNLIISDSIKRRIFRYIIESNDIVSLLNMGLGKITSMSFDSYGNNLYVCDEVKRKVEVWSLSTKFGLAVYKSRDGEIPKSVVVIPEHGIFFVAVIKDKTVNINRVNMDGTQVLPHLTGGGIVGPNIMLTYDKKHQKLYWFDSGAEVIEYMNLDGSGRRVAVITGDVPVSIAVQDNLLMWINQNSPNLYSHEISVMSEFYSYNKSVLKLIVEDDNIQSLAVITQIESQHLHPCQSYLKHGCSHLCLVTSNNNGICACPLGMHLAPNNQTCLKHAHCTDSQFKCRTDDICISRIQRCDGHSDCPSGDDEKDCEINNCRENQFKCENGQCIDIKEKCDHVYDCSDHSDEINCPFHCDREKDQFQCGSGECIPKLWRCDSFPDCSDKSDENDCNIECPEDMFKCKTGTCIAKGWECDGDIDCTDGSDEHEDCEILNCKTTEFHCGNGRCISLNFLCNSENDCGDNSDELQCNPRQIEPVCGAHEMLCSKEYPKCIPQKSRCNGTAECPRGEDEKDCSNCQISEFQCKNMRCIINTWVCDKENDCGDNSDEEPEMCSHKVGSVGTTRPCEEFSCKSGECLPLYLVCNGIKNCADDSDEGPKCDTVCNSSPCEHSCVKTPISARCACNKGFTLGSDGHSCHDIDECAEEKCSQICHNYPGGFNCSCVQDYLLKSDRVTCKAKGNRMTLILSGDDEIRQITHNFNRIDLLVFDPGAQILGLDVDTRNNRVFWSSGSSNKISVLDISTRQRTFMEDIDRPGKLAFDWLTGNVYYIDNSSPNSIKVCDLANNKRSTILTVGHGIIISNLAVDPPSGLIFYSQVRSSTLQRPVSEILSYSFENQNSSVLVTSDLSWVSGIVVDRIRRFIYWSDLYYHVIEKVQFDGSRRQIVFQSEVHRPESLVLFEDSLTWLSRGSSEIKKCALYGEHKGHCETISLFIYDIKFVTIMQEARQPNMTNPCSDSCDIYSICVPTPRGARCVCEDGIIISPNEICDHSGSKSYSESRAFGGNSKQFLTAQKPPVSGNSSAVIGILMTALIACGLVAGYLYIRKKKSNVVLETMHFQNPAFGLTQLENNFQSSELVPGEHRYENPATKPMQHSENKFGILFKEKDHLMDKNSKPEPKDCDSDSDTYERTDMKANLIR